MRSVVVAEDEPLIRMAVADFLLEEDFLVLQADNAEEALAILRDQALGVHVLFTDVRMPGEMDGLALSYHVKEHWPWIGLLVTSGHAMLNEAELPAGGRFLPKPYHHARVLGLVRELSIGG